MIWHISGLQGGGKTWFATALAQDYFLREKRAIWANYKLSFGQLIDYKNYFAYKYNNCVIIQDEAYGVADSHKSGYTVNDTVSYVNLQARKRDVEALWITQLEGDLYKRVRENAHRKVLCQNLGDDEHPYLYITITNQYQMPVCPPLEFDEETVKMAKGLYDTDETIMPMYLSSGMTLENALAIYEDCSNKETFYTLINRESPYLTERLANAIYTLIKDGKHERVKQLLTVNT